MNPTKFISAILAFAMVRMAEGDGGGPVDTPEAAAGKKKTVYIDVTMKGQTVKDAEGKDIPRVVSFPENTKVKKEVLFDSAGKATGVRFDFANGESDTTSLEDLVKWGLFERSAAHGISQKLGDSYASKDSVDDCQETYMETKLQLSQGKWAEGREGGGAGSSVLLKALVEATGQTPEAVRATLATLSPKEKLVLRAEPQLQPIIQRLEAEKAGGVDRGAVAAKFGLVSASVAQAA